MVKQPWFRWVSVLSRALSIHMLIFSAVGSTLPSPEDLLFLASLIPLALWAIHVNLCLLSHASMMKCSFVSSSLVCFYEYQKPKGRLFKAIWLYWPGPVQLSGNISQSWEKKAYSKDLVRNKLECQFKFREGERVLPGLYLFQAGIFTS